MIECPSQEIVIVDGDPDHAAELHDVLRSRGHSVVTFREPLSAASSVEIGDAVLAIFVPRSRALWKRDLEAFCKMVRAVKPGVWILCVLPWRSNGPDDRLIGESLKVSVVHEG